MIPRPAEICGSTAAVAWFSLLRNGGKGGLFVLTFNSAMPNDSMFTRRKFLELSSLALISACTDRVHEIDGRTSRPPGWLADFEAFAQDLVTTNRIPGLTLSIAQHGRVLYEMAFGYRDVERGIAATLETVFGLGSVSKSFTAVAIMQLQDAGKLSVADPVVEWLPELGGSRFADWQGMTLHHLLSHSSGLPSDFAFLNMHTSYLLKEPDLQRLGWQLNPSTMRAIDTYEELLEFLSESDFELLAPPGRVFSYSNEGYALLEGIIERASGRGFLPCLREHIWEPLDMTRTASNTEALARLSNLTQIYARTFVNGDWSPVFHSPAWMEGGQIYGFGGLASNVRDLTKYLQVFANEGQANGQRILSASAVTEMTKPHVKMHSGGRFYGYGFFVRPNYHGQELWSHGGGGKGISAQIAVVPQTGITVAALANLESMPTWPLSRGAVNALGGLPLDTESEGRVAIDIDPRTLERFEGTYENPLYHIRFYLRDGIPYLQGSSRQERPATPFAVDGVMFPSGRPVRFLTDDQGAVWAVGFSNRALPRVD